MQINARTTLCVDDSCSIWDDIVPNAHNGLDLTASRDQDSIVKKVFVEASRLHSQQGGIRENKEVSVCSGLVVCVVKSGSFLLETADIGGVIDDDVIPLEKVLCARDPEVEVIFGYRRLALVKPRDINSMEIWS